MKDMLAIRKDFYPTVSNFLKEENFPTYKTGNLLSTTPSNIGETEDVIQIELMVPGRKKEDFTIEIDNDRIRISAEAKVLDEKESKQMFKREFSLNKVDRTFKVKSGLINYDGVEAKYEDGILLLTLPKREEMKPVKKTIDIM